MKKERSNLKMMKDAPFHVHQTSNYTKIIFIVIVQSQFMYLQHKCVCEFDLTKGTTCKHKINP